MSYQVTIQPSGHTFTVSGGETVLSAAVEAGFNLPYGCRNGACGACKGKVLKGQVYQGDYQGNAMTMAEAEAGMALFCCALPLSDLVIECREVINKDGIRPRIMPARVQKMEKLSHDVMALFLKLPSNERLQFLAGQYIDFLLKDGKRRAFSLANAPHNDDLLELHLRLIPGGQFTEYVFNEMHEKAILRFEGPFGSFYLREDSDKPIIFVAGGTGFAPIKGMLEHAFAEHTDRELVLYWGVRSRKDLYMAELPQQWLAERPNFSFIPVLSDPQPDDQWQGRTGYVHEAVLADFPDLSGYQVYACGAPVMVDTARDSFVKTRKLSEDEFFADAFVYAADTETAAAQ